MLKAAYRLPAGVLPKRLGRRAEPRPSRSLQRSHGERTQAMRAMSLCGGSAALGEQAGKGAVGSSTAPRRGGAQDLGGQPHRRWRPHPRGADQPPRHLPPARSRVRALGRRPAPSWKGVGVQWARPLAPAVGQHEMNPTRTRSAKPSVLHNRKRCPLRLHSRR